MTSLSDPEAEVQSNGAFAMGTLIFHTQTDLTPHYPSILQALHPLFKATSPGGPVRMENARDNACGAVARMILKNIDAVPLEQVRFFFSFFFLRLHPFKLIPTPHFFQVLPIFVQALPLTRDFAESEKTVSTIQSSANQSFTDVLLSFK